MKIIPIKENVNASKVLRNIADDIESGRLEDEVTIIVGCEVFHAGCHCDKQAAVNAVYNMNFGIAKIMNAAVNGDEEV